MVQSGVRVRLSLQLAHRHLFLLIDRIRKLVQKFQKRKEGEEAYGGNKKERKKEKKKKTKQKQYGRDKKQRTSIFRKWLLARRRRKPKHLLAGSKSGEARILWPRPVKEQQDQQPSTFPGREKGNLSCIIYMGVREREREMEEKRWRRGRKRKAFFLLILLLLLLLLQHTPDIWRRRRRQP